MGAGAVLVVFTRLVPHAEGRAWGALGCATTEVQPRGAPAVDEAVEVVVGRGLGEGDGLCRKSARRPRLPDAIVAERSGLGVRVSIRRIS